MTVRRQLEIISRTKENTIPKTSIQAFLSRLIDYAGLFPPASLPLETSIRNYITYQTCKDSWMLGRFIIPAVQLDRLAPYISLFSKDQPLSISAIGRRSDNAAACLKGLYDDLEKIISLRHNHGDVIKIGVFEMPLPPVSPVRDLLETIAVETAKYNLQTFCEATVPVDADWGDHMIETLDAIAAHNKDSGTILGFKLRTGGITADAFPTPEQVAAVLIGCRDRNIALKFTAGLHHPIRMYRDEVNAQMHGFLNVFTAGLLANVHNLDVWKTAEILADESPASFSFTDQGLAWRNLTVPVSEMIRLRESALCSYGSCSFDEPRDDLRMLEIYNAEENLK